MHIDNLIEEIEEEEKANAPTIKKPYSGVKHKTENKTDENENENKTDENGNENENENKTDENESEE